MDSTLLTVGGTRLIEVGLGDELGDRDNAFKSWSREALEKTSRAMDIDNFHDVNQFGRMFSMTTTTTKWTELRASLKATAFAAIMCIRGPPCKPGKIAEFNAEFAAGKKCSIYRHALYIMASKNTKKSLKNAEFNGRHYFKP